MRRNKRRTVTHNTSYTLIITKSLSPNYIILYCSESVHRVSFIVYHNTHERLLLFLIFLDVCMTQRWYFHYAGVMDNILFFALTEKEKIEGVNILTLLLYLTCLSSCVFPDAL